jgi:hypothetical protein
MSLLRPVVYYSSLLAGGLYLSWSLRTETVLWQDAVTTYQDVSIKRRGLFSTLSCSVLIEGEYAYSMTKTVPPFAKLKIQRY